MAKYNFASRNISARMREYDRLIYPNGAMRCSSSNTFIEFFAFKIIFDYFLYLKTLVFYFDGFSPLLLHMLGYHTCRVRKCPLQHMHKFRLSINLDKSEKLRTKNCKNDIKFHFRPGSSNLHRLSRWLKHD